MKAIFAVGMSLVFLLESLFPKGMALTESAKMFDLMGHFQEHMLESGNDMSFAEFLWMHYNPDSDHENEEHHHERLPNLSLQSAFVGIIYESFNAIVSPVLAISFDSEITLPEYKNGYFYLFSLNLIHPPQ